MKTFRLGFSIVIAILLVGGYGASQWAVFTGDAQGYALRVDQPSIRMLALLILVVAVGLAFVRKPSEEVSSQTGETNDE